MLQAVRPFTKIVGPVFDNSVIGVELRDSANNPLLCNYIEVYPEVSGSTSVTSSNLRYQVFLSGIGVTTPLNTANVSSTTNTSSGVLGVSKSGLGIAEFNLDYGDECSAIHIFYEEGTGGPDTMHFIVNYGIRKVQRDKWLLEVKPNLGRK